MHVPATTSAITKASCPPSKEGKGREFSTARLMLRDAMNPTGDGGNRDRDKDRVRDSEVDRQRM